jgi:hypothetical protein
MKKNIKLITLEKDNRHNPNTVLMPKFLAKTDQTQKRKSTKNINTPTITYTNNASTLTEQEMKEIFKYNLKDTFTNAAKTVTNDEEFKKKTREIKIYTKERLNKEDKEEEDIEIDVKDKSSLDSIDTKYFKNDSKKNINYF